MRHTLKTGAALLTILYLFTGCDSSTTSGTTDSSLLGLSGYDKIDLNTTQKESLAYMWHEEKLAHDLYLALNAVNPSMPLAMIPVKSEIIHMQYVEDLVAWYDIDVTNIPDYNTSYSAAELDALAPGEFAMDEVQNLYNTLYNLGEENLTSSLQVGCIVEVTDVNDLNRYIEQAGENRALIDTFEILRAGSYKHYWKFHDTLKVIDGIGCAFFRDGVDYNKTGEYPVN
ncbi:DUF2202 domain-containing protein [Sulfurimonas sp. HSL3-7]|uniref:DUF2202 domain-containing protein n=1 Tax=Sulfonitrofixus jiaomeiensis TaxID=3131938 RepID=UPI0031F881A8